MAEEMKEMQLDSDQQRLDKFFSTLKERRTAFAENYKFFANQLAPNFNAFKFINPNEVKLSEILAEFLNPHGSHAQGDIFLRQFFVDLGIDYPNTGDPIRVMCEVPTSSIANSLRRIDIKIRFGNQFGLAIENKPWANDSEDQLRDYAKHLQNKYKDNWRLVYLSGDGSDPSKHSANKMEIAEWEDKYQKKNFEFIVDWLKKCEMQCQATRVRHFLKDFIEYCQKIFLGEVNQVDANVVKKFILEEQNFELAEVVSRQFIEIKKQLIVGLLEDIKNKLQDKLPGWTFSDSFDKEQPHVKTLWSGMFFHNPAWQYCRLGFEFSGNNCKKIIFGVKKKGDGAKFAINSTEYKVLVSDLQQALNRGRQASSSKWWPWWSYITDNDYDKATTNFWCAINDKTMADFLIDKIVELNNQVGIIISAAEEKI